MTISQVICHGQDVKRYPSGVQLEQIFWAYFFAVL